MLHRWAFILQMLRALFFLKGKRYHRFRPLAAGVWTVLYCLIIYLTAVNMVRDEKNRCLDNMIHNTFRVYNAQAVKSSHTLAKLFPGVFCYIRMFARDLGSVWSRGLSLYLNLAKDLDPSPLRLSQRLRVILMCVYMLQPVIDVLLTMYCISKEKSQQVRYFFILIIPPWIQTILFIPPTAMVTIFFILLDIGNETMDILCKKIDSITTSMGPRPFLALKQSQKCPLFLKSAVTKELIFSLRKSHNEIIEFMEEVMNTFQADILVFLVSAFYMNVLYNYTIVFNTAKLFQSWEVAVLVLTTFLSTIILTMNIWIVCAGPSIIQDQIRMLQLQSRHHFANFNVYGMFKLNISLLFTMCASIASYIVILIQFASDPQETTDTLQPPNSTTPWIDNFTNPQS